jgi:hypothetical protein
VLELVDRCAWRKPYLHSSVGRRLRTTEKENHDDRVIPPVPFFHPFAALVAAVGFATLTDARPHEPEIKARELTMRHAPSPAVQESMQKLEMMMNTELTSVSIEDVMQTIMNATGAAIAVEEGAIDDETRAKRLNVKAENVPAHLMLFESSARCILR